MDRLEALCLLALELGVVSDQRPASPALRAPGIRFRPGEGEQHLLFRGGEADQTDERGS